MHRVTVCGLSSGLGMQHIETESSRHNKPSAPSNLLIYLERHLPGALFRAKAQCKGLDGVVATGKGGGSNERHCQRQFFDLYYVTSDRGMID